MPKFWCYDGLSSVNATLLASKTMVVSEVLRAFRTFVAGTNANKTQSICWCLRRTWAEVAELKEIGNDQSGILREYAWKSN